MNLRELWDVNLRCQTLKSRFKLATLSTSWNMFFLRNLQPSQIPECILVQSLLKRVFLAPNHVRWRCLEYPEFLLLASAKTHVWQVMSDEQWHVKNECLGMSDETPNRTAWAKSQRWRRHVTGARKHTLNMWSNTSIETRGCLDGSTHTNVDDGWTALHSASSNGCCQIQYIETCHVWQLFLQTRIRNAIIPRHESKTQWWMVGVAFRYCQR